MPAGKRALNDQLYVFSNNNGNRHHNAAMITAHGEQLLFGSTLSRTFTVPAGTGISFFAPHGSTLTTTFYNCGRGANRPVGVVEIINAGAQCHDYNLTKFEGYHCNGVTGIATLDKIIDCCYDGQRGLSYDNLETLVEDPTVDVDVITVRNRWGCRDMTLSRLIFQLINAGYHYNEIYCSFCRGPAWVSWGSISNCGTPDHRF
ncbi:putative adhesin [Iodobacter sp.]|uniref:putative adhesin n=1 Tax=Iodobacter sp. TaxID=1915058 RepID=UPI0025E2D902|nr:hypothetical protein [Iodobacter sp.]